jgi:glycosyltransferase involved in cell wall biosynthesis
MAHIVHVVTVPETLFFFRGQGAHFRSRGHTVSAVASPGDALHHFAREEGVEVHPVSMTRSITPVRDLVSLVGLVRLFRRIRPDVVHGHTPKGGLLGMLAAALAGVPLRVYHVHGLRLATETGLKRKVLAGTERVAGALAHHVLPVSGSVRDAVVEGRLAPGEKVRVLGAGSINGVDAEKHFRPDRWQANGLALRRRLGIPPDAPVLGFVGRLVREKGLDELARAWTEIRERVPDAHFLLVGPSEPQDPPSPETVRLLEEDSRVHLVGRDRNVRPYYAAMDVLTLPSHREGYPVVVLEASAMELPVVATRVQGCVDAVVEGGTGRLVSRGDVNGLARALESYLRQPALREEHGRRARERVLAEYRPGDLWNAMENLYPHEGAR